MVIDSHCHAWQRWPYDAAARDSAIRADDTALLQGMERYSVDHAIVVSAGIGRTDPRTDNRDNNAVVARWVRENPLRLSQLADIDSFWSDSYHTPGVVERVRDIVDRYHPIGLTHYLAERDDGWLTSRGAHALAIEAESQGLILSISAPPAWHASLFELASAHPQLKFAVHHFGLLHVQSPNHSAELDRFCAGLESTPNMYVKASGLHYLVERSWNYPFAEAHHVVTRVTKSTGPERLLWGSDFPAAGRYIMHEQAVELFRTTIPGPSTEEVALMYGENARKFFGIEACSHN